MDSFHIIASLVGIVAGITSLIIFIPKEEKLKKWKKWIGILAIFFILLCLLFYFGFALFSIKTIKVNYINMSIEGSKQGLDYTEVNGYPAKIEIKMIETKSSEDNNFYVHIFHKERDLPKPKYYHIASFKYQPNITVYRDLYLGNSDTKNTFFEIYAIINKRENYTSTTNSNIITIDKLEGEILFQTEVKRIY